MVVLRKSKPSSMWTTRVFSGASRSPSVAAFPVHHDDEVVSETDHPPVAQAALAACLPLV
jgi:hypothetical protein